MGVTQQLCEARGLFEWLAACVTMMTLMMRIMTMNGDYDDDVDDDDGSGDDDDDDNDENDDDDDDDGASLGEHF